MSDLQDQACHLYDQADKLRSSRNCGSNTSSSQSASDWQDQSHMATQSNDYYSGSGQYVMIGLSQNESILADYCDS